MSWSECSECKKPINILNTETGFPSGNEWFCIDCFRKLPTLDPHCEAKIKNEEQFAKELDNVLKEIKEVLIEKNIRYGDSALSPIGVFAGKDAEALIRVRIDDKLKRISNQRENSGDTEDAELDLIGYLMLLRIAQKRKENG